jgi:hypothetical protein
VAAKPLLVWLMIVSNYGGVLFNIDIIDLEILPWESILSNQYFMERASWTLLNFLGAFYFSGPKMCKKSCLCRFGKPNSFGEWNTQLSTCRGPGPSALVNNNDLPFVHLYRFQMLMFCTQNQRILFWKGLFTRR